MKLSSCLLILTALATPLRGLAATAPELTEALRIIRAVGPEGQGNAAASRAWKDVLARNDAANLLPVLTAMDGANDYALNWLCVAVDGLVAQAAKAGRPLPLPELGKFLLETSHHATARRRAFELIRRGDPATAEKLLPGMLNDPSLEIRYDAVSQLLGQAQAALARTNQPGATLLLQQAVSFARDADQIDEIAKQLKALGRPVNLQKHFAFLADWKIIGPFDNTGNVGFETSYPPELKLDFSAEYDGKKGKVRWQEYSTSHEYGMVDMNQPLGKLKGVLAYATTDFYADRAQSVELRLGGKNSWKVWLNGKFLFGRDEYHTNTEIDQYVMPAQLQPGRNTILVKVCQNEEVQDWTNEWEFQLRVTDSLGTPISQVAANTNSNRN